MATTSSVLMRPATHAVAIAMATGSPIQRLTATVRVKMSIKVTGEAI